MKTGIVIGTVVATRKDERLIGHKLLLTQPVDSSKKPKGEPIIAVDTVGAGIGEFIIYNEGTAARYAVNNTDAPVDAAIIGIIDNLDVHFDLLDNKGENK